MSTCELPTGPAPPGLTCEICHLAGQRLPCFPCTRAYVRLDSDRVLEMFGIDQASFSIPLGRIVRLSIQPVQLEAQLGWDGISHEEWNLATLVTTSLGQTLDSEESLAQLALNRFHRHVVARDPEASASLEACVDLQRAFC